MTSALLSEVHSALRYTVELPSYLSKLAYVYASQTILTSVYIWGRKQEYQSDSLLLLLVFGNRHVMDQHEIEIGSESTILSLLF